MKCLRMDDKKGLFLRALRELGQVCFLIGKYEDPWIIFKNCVEIQQILNCA